MMLFSERKKLAGKYEKWISENKQILDCPLTVISWLVSEGYLQKTKISELEKELVESKNQIRGFQKAIEKRDKQIQGLNKGLSKTQKQSYKIKESKSQDIITIANQIEKERNLSQQVADLEAKLALTKKALQLAREYMFKVMCADDVPSEEWFIKCAKGNDNA